MIIKDLIHLVYKEKRKKDRAKVVQNIAVGMGVVAVAGVATGILIAPKSGKELREDMKKKAINTVETLKEKVEDVKDKMEDAKEKTEEVNKEIKDGYDEIKKDINETAKNISKKL